MKSRHVRACVLLLAGSVFAQKMPVQDQAGRVVQLIDARGLLSGLEAKPTEAQTRLRDLAAFAREFVDPPLGAGDDVQALGDRYLVVLAQPVQAAWIERHMTGARPDAQPSVLVEIQFLDVPKAAAVEHLLPLFGPKDEPPADPAPRTLLQKVIETAEAAEQVRKTLHGIVGVELITIPRVITRPLERAHIATGNQVSYVRDLKIEVTPDGAKIADPVVDQVFDGMKIDVTVACLGDAKLAVRCDLLQQHVERPIGEFKATLGEGIPISIQLPRTTTIRMQQKAIVPDGGAVLLAVSKTSGSYLCAILRAASVK